MSESCRRSGVQNAARLGGVALHLLAERPERSEALLIAQSRHELHLDLTPIQIAVEVEHVGLQQRLATADGGPRTETRHTGALALARSAYPYRENPGDGGAAPLERHVGSGKPQLRSESASGLHPAARRFWLHLTVVEGLVLAGASLMTTATFGQWASRPLLVVGTAVPLLSVALLIVMWALLRLPVGRRTRNEWVRLTLDGATVAAGAALFLWQLVLRPLVASHTDVPMFLGMLLISLMLLNRASYVTTAGIVLVSVAGLGIAVKQGLTRAKPPVRTTYDTNSL